MFPRPSVLVTGAAAAGTGSQMTSQTAYFVYWGRTSVPMTVTDLMVKLHDGSAGASVTSGEMGVFSTPGPPNAAGQTLTKISSATVTDFTAAGPAWCTAGGALSIVIPAGTFLWIGIRVQATTMPIPSGSDSMLPLGQQLRTASATVFSSGTTYTGAFSTSVVVATVFQPLLYARVAA